MASLVYGKHPNGTTYVYENVSYWDKDSKKAKHRRRCIGKLDPATNEVIPTRKKAGTSPATDVQTADNKSECTVLTIGPALLLDKALTETGLGKLLGTVFGDDADRILTCAYYLASEKGALCHVEQWSTAFKHPYGAMLADQRISELFQRITPELQMEFFRLWTQANLGSEYFAMDITSVSSYSEFIDYVRYGYNRDGEDLAQINLLMVTSEVSGLPIYFRILSGSIRDVSTLNESLVHLDFLDVKVIHLAMDKGFYSEENVDAMYARHYRFTVGVPFVSAVATDAVERNREDIDNHHNMISVGGDDIFTVTEVTKWKGHRCYIHTYYDSQKAERENKKFIHRLKSCHEMLVSGTERKEDAAFIGKFFTVKTYPKRKRKVEYNEEAIRKHKINTIGWFVLLSNDIKNAAEALRIYRDKDAVEKNFDDLKNALDMKRLRIHTNVTMEGRIFIQFISLILSVYLRGIIKKSGWDRNHNLQEVFSEVKTIREVSFSDKRKTSVTKLSKRQKEIMDLFQISV